MNDNTLFNPETTPEILTVRPAELDAAVEVLAQAVPVEIREMTDDKTTI